MTKAKITITKNTAKPIQSGENTQIHFHAIIPHNFNVTKTMVNKPKNPIPLALVVIVVLDIFSIEI